MGHAQLELERARRHDGLREHLTVGEEIRLAARQHWIVLVKPLLIAVAATVFVAWTFIKAPSRMGDTLPSILLGGLALAWLAFLWRVIVRRHDMFVATDKRILKYQGIFITDVPMMRMSKVTDMRFTRSVGGEIFGYGTIVIESAGQDQAIRDVRYLPDPVENYRRLCEVIFGDKHAPGHRKKPKTWRRQLDRLTASRRGGGDPDDWDHDPAPEPTGPIHTPVNERRSRAIPTAPSNDRTHRPTSEGEVLFESEDIKARRRAADTGPIHYYPTNNPD